MPAFGLSESGARIDGTALCVIGGAEGVVLSADLAKVDAATLDLFAERIAHLGGADASLPLTDAALVGEPERRVLERLNDTASPF